MGSSDGNRPPPLTGVAGSASLGSVDLGQVISSVARSIWSEVEARAAMVIELDAWGPAVANEALLMQLITNIAREMLREIPAGDPAQHLLSLTAHASPDDTISIELRHLEQRSEAAPADPAARPESSAVATLGERQLQSTQFWAHVEKVEDPSARACYRITLRLAF